MLPKKSTYVKCYDGQTKWISTYIKKEFDNEPVFNKIFLKTKIKIYEDGVTDFYDKQISKVDSDQTCLNHLGICS